METLQQKPNLDLHCNRSTRATQCHPYSRLFVSVQPRPFGYQTPKQETSAIVHSWKKSGELTCYILIPCQKSRLNLTLLHTVSPVFVVILFLLDPGGNDGESGSTAKNRLRITMCSIFQPMKTLGKKLEAYATCLCWTCIFSSALPIGGLDDSKQLQAQPTTDHGVKISKYVSSFFNFGLSSARAVAIPYKMANSFPVLLNERQNGGQFSTVRTASDALPWLVVWCLWLPAGMAWFGLERMIAPCLGMIFACNLLQSVFMMNLA